MAVAVLAGLFVFAAGLGSFLSPCVLPLVPGYLSMLSGVGVDKLREGEGETSKLFSSALAFVIGLSVVFITMGATASAVGQFLLTHRDLLAPIAGAVIILFGLHLIGWLIKLPVRAGLVVGGILVAIGAVLNLRTAESVVKPIYFYAASLVEPRCPHARCRRKKSRHRQRLPPGVCIRAGLDPVHRSNPHDRAGHCSFARQRAGWHHPSTLYSAGLSIPFLLTAVGVARFMK